MQIICTQAMPQMDGECDINIICHIWHPVELNVLFIIQLEIMINV